MNHEVSRLTVGEDNGRAGKVAESVSPLAAIASHRADLIAAIPKARASVAAIMRVRVKKRRNGKKTELKVEAGWGSGFSIVDDKYLLTAFHVLNDGKPREPDFKHYAIVVPDNGDPFYFFPVVAFPVERSDVDMAVLELGACSKASVHLPAMPVSFSEQKDGVSALTIGFPAPGIAGLRLDEDGNFQGGQFFLKSHANEGIVAAQYGLPGGHRMYELNIGWHNGESGGPITTVSDRPASFSVMQHYRNVQTPHGIVPGPHRGYALTAIRKELEDLGVTVAA